MCVAYKEILLAVRDHLESATWKETEDAVSRRDPDGSVVDLAVEINSPEFTECSVLVAAVLSGFTARPLAHLLVLLTGRVERATRAREPGTLVHLGHGNTIPARENDRSTRQ